MDFLKMLIELRLRDHSVKLLIDRTVPVPSTTSTAMLSAAFATLWVDAFPPGSQGFSYLNFSYLYVRHFNSNE
jgi:hypothetical protein